MNQRNLLVSWSHIKSTQDIMFVCWPHRWLDFHASVKGNKKLYSTSCELRERCTMETNQDEGSRRAIQDKYMMMEPIVTDMHDSHGALSLRYNFSRDYKA